MQVLGHAKQSAVVTAVVRDRFLADHQRLEALLGHVLAALAANDAASSSELWAALDSGLRAHLEAEETTMMPELVGVHARDARVLLQEHHHIRRRLKDLGDETDSRTVRMASLRNFIDEMHAHARTEDRILYPWADALLDEPTRVSLIDALAKGRAARGTPARPSGR